MDDRKLQAMFDLLRTLEGETEAARLEYCKKKEDAKQTRELLARLRNGAVSVPVSPIPPPPAKTPALQAPRTPRVQPQKVSMSALQTALIRFAIDRNDVFSATEAMRYLVKTRALHACTSTTVAIVRKLLADGTYFIRTGERQATRYIYHQSTQVQEV